jgi:hypothetical protein
MPLNPSGQISLGGPSTSQSVALELGLSATATISLNDTVVRTLGGVASGQISLDTFWGKSNITIIPTQKGMIAFGFAPGPPLNRYVNTANLVSNTGVVASDTTASAYATGNRSAASYGTDKGIFAFGVGTTVPAGSLFRSNFINLVSNTGAVASDTTAPTVGRDGGSASVYGGDKAIFNYGSKGPSFPTATRFLSASNLVTNTGVMGTDTPTVATASSAGQAAAFGSGRAIFGFNSSPSTPVANFNLVSSTGVFEATTATAITGRSGGSMTTYGGDKAIYAFGQQAPTGVTNVVNLISNTGVIASNSPGAGTNRTLTGAARFGGDKGLVYGGASPSPSVVYYNIYNLISNTGVVAANSPGVGLARNQLSGLGYSST